MLVPWPYWIDVLLRQEIVQYSMTNEVICFGRARVLGWVLHKKNRIVFPTYVLSPVRLFACPIH